MAHCDPNSELEDSDIDDLSDIDGFNDQEYEITSKDLQVLRNDEAEDSEKAKATRKVKWISMIDMILCWIFRYVSHYDQKQIF